MIANKTISLVHETIDIADLIGKYVPLKRRGANQIGCCPFHNEKTPSFTVSSNKGLFKCFGCSESGNVVDFYMKYHGAAYPDAIKALAEMYSIPFETDSRPGSTHDNRKEKDTEALYVANESVCNFFAQCLQKSPEAIEYLHKRGITDEQITLFRIGYAPFKEKHFFDYAHSQQLDIQVLANAGLVVKSQSNGAFHPFFHGRIMFPIQDTKGRVVAFSGRAFTDNNLKNSPKYVNSPETAIFKKSLTLYNLDKAKKYANNTSNNMPEELRGKLFITEGFTDVISMCKLGIHNTIASCGTALTEEACKLIAKTTNNVVLFYDGDTAGTKATLRAIPMLLAKSLQVSVIRLPKEEDPDSYCRKQQDTAFVKSATDCIKYLYDILIAPYGSDIPVQQLSAAIETMTETIAALPEENIILSGIYIDEVARFVNMERTIIAAAVQKYKSNHEKQALRAQNSAQAKAAESTANNQPTQTTAHTDTNKQYKNKNEQQIFYAEKGIIFALLLYGNAPIDVVDNNENSTQIPIYSFLQQEIAMAPLTFEVHKQIFNSYLEIVQNKSIDYSNPIATINSLKANGTLPLNYAEECLKIIEDEITADSIRIIASDPFHDAGIITQKFLTQKTKQDGAKNAAILQTHFTINAINSYKLTHIVVAIDGIFCRMLSCKDPDEEKTLQSKYRILVKLKKELSTLTGINQII